MALSDQLTELAARAKAAEDRAGAVQGKAKADVQADVEQARTSAQDRAKKLRESAEANKNKLSVCGTTCSARGTSTSRRFATTSTPNGLSTTWIAPSGAPSTERTTRRSRLSSRTRRSRRPSTPCSTPNWRGWRRTSCRRPDH